MTARDAAKILGLAGEISPAIARAAWLDATRRFHPDRNPGGEEMQKLVNAAYETLRDWSGDVHAQATDYGDLLNAALGAIVDLPGLSIEICGAWVWVSGDTLTHRGTLKAAGYRWAPKKKLWYFRPAEYRSHARGSVKMDDIRAKYGSTNPDAPQRQQVAA